MRQIADAGFLVAYWNRRDGHHAWARQVQLVAPVCTCDAVIAEASHLLGTAEPLVRMLVKGDLVADFSSQAHGEDLLRWLIKFRDLRPDFADACVVKLGELYPHLEILTVDRSDFSAYRTLAGQPLRCAFPPV